MGFSLRRTPIVGLLALLALDTCRAFVPTKLAFTKSSTKELVNNNLYFDSSTIAASSALSMGVLEDFVSGTDAKTRKTEYDKCLAELQKRVEKINELESTIEDLGDDELQAKTEEFKARLKKGEDINGPLIEEAFAVVREAAW
jgi:hypothetical protein